MFKIPDLSYLSKTRHFSADCYIFDEFSAISLFGDRVQFLIGAVSSRLERSTPERALRVRSLAVDIVSCCWARYFTFKVPLSTQVNKCVWANLLLDWGATLLWTSIPSRGGSRNIPSQSLHATETRMSFGLMSYLAHICNFTFYLFHFRLKSTKMTQGTMIIVSWMTLLYLVSLGSSPILGEVRSHLISGKTRI